MLDVMSLQARMQRPPGGASAKQAHPCGGRQWPQRPKATMRATWAWWWTAPCMPPCAGSWPWHPAAPRQRGYASNVNSGASRIPRFSYVQ